MSSVLKISEAVSLGIHAGMIIAGTNEKVSASVIAKQLMASEHHLAKVMQRLVRSGIIMSNRGPKGGFSLARDAKEISLLDIYVAVDGEFPSQNCFFSTEVCNGHCPMGDLLVKVNHDVKKYFETKNLSDLI
jgi:Rrf2 family protein